MTIFAELFYALVLFAFVYGAMRLGRRYVRRATSALDRADEAAANDMLTYVSSKGVESKGVDFKMDVTIKRERAVDLLWQ